MVSLGGRYGVANAMNWKTSGFIALFFKHFINMFYLFTIAGFNQVWEYFKHEFLDMVIVGVNIVNGLPTKWKIENSWGEDNGIKGYYVMSPAFFDTFVYQAVILKKHLNQEEIKATEHEPIHLPPWDPMGTLAD